MHKRAAALLLPALLAACTVGPRYEEPPDMATPAQLRPGDRRGDGRARGLGPLAGFGSTRARHADHARARPRTRPSRRPRPGLPRPGRCRASPSTPGSRRSPRSRDRQKAQFSTDDPLAARRHPHRHLARGIRRAVGDRPVRLAAQRVPRDRPAHRGGRGRPRRRAAVDRRGDGAGLVRDDRRARAPRAAAAAAREPGGQHPDPRRHA